MHLEIIAPICSGVVPQQPPAILTPSLIKSYIKLANSSGPTSKQVLPSRSTGKPALGLSTTGKLVNFNNWGNSFCIWAGPSPQLKPMASAPKPSTIKAAAATSPPVKSLPSISKVKVTTTGKSQFSFAAKIAALVS